MTFINFLNDLNNKFKTFNESKSIARLLMIIFFSFGDNKTIKFRENKDMIKIQNNEMETYKIIPHILHQISRKYVYAMYVGEFVKLLLELYSQIQELFFHGDFYRHRIWLHYLHSAILNHSCYLKFGLMRPIDHTGHYILFLVKLQMSKFWDFHNLLESID